MKKILLLIIIAAAAIVYGCENSEPCTSCECTFQGEHKLMCIKSDSASADCQYMVVFGDKVRYMWQMNDTLYAMSVINVGKVRVKIDEGVIEPYIKYRWISCMSVGDLQSRINNRVVYVMLVCSTEDCPPQLIGSAHRE